MIGAIPLSNPMISAPTNQRWILLRLSDWILKIGLDRIFWIGLVFLKIRLDWILVSLDSWIVYLDWIGLLNWVGFLDWIRLDSLDHWILWIIGFLEHWIGLDSWIGFLDWILGLDSWIGFSEGLMKDWLRVWPFVIELAPTGARGQ